MSVSSEDSLTELPLPFDISYAVSKALNISEHQAIGGAAEDYAGPPDRNQYFSCYGAGGQPEEMRAGTDACCPAIYNYMQEYHPQPPYYHCSTALAPGFPTDQQTLASSFDNPASLMNVSSSSSFEQFYELSDMAAQSGPSPFNGRTQSCSYGQFYTESSCSPPRKRRNTIQYCDDPDNGSDHYTDWPWTACLDNSSLWTKFDEIGTEMVVTKGGR